MARTRAKKQNFIVNYFSDFGLRQICDFLMIAGAVVIIVGLCTKQIVMTVGLAIYIVASAVAIIRSVKVLLSDINHRAPEYKNAVVNVIIMAAIFALAVFGFIWSLLY